MKGLQALGLSALILLLAACNGGQAWQRRTIEQRENAVADATKHGRMDTAGFMGLMQAYDVYVKAYPADTNSANYLFKEADLYRYLHNPQKSIQIYASIYDHYPQYFKRPYALFLQGFIYENEVRNLDSARVKYQLFLKTYPEHAIAKDVAITLSNLGKSPEQMMKEFEEKERADSLAKAGNQ